MVKKAQVWIEAVIYLLIGLAIIGLILGLILPKIGKLKDKAIVDENRETLGAINEKLLEVYGESAGSQRVVDMNIKKGAIYVDTNSEKVYYLMKDSRAKYTELDYEVNYEDMTIFTEKSITGDYRVNLTLDYAETLDFITECEDGIVVFQKSPTPYKAIFKNAGYDNINDKTQIGLTGAICGSDMPECTVDSDCDDGLFCNGIETCSNGFCLPGEDIICTGLNLVKIRDCNNTPDAFPLTLDTRLSFLSVCNEELDKCMAGESTFKHKCNINNCSAGCETLDGSDCPQGQHCIDCLCEGGDCVGKTCQQLQSNLIETGANFYPMAIPCGELSNGCNIPIDCNCPLDQGLSCTNGFCLPCDDSNRNIPVLTSVLAVSLDDCSVGWNSVPDSKFGYRWGGSFHAWHPNIPSGVCEQDNAPMLGADYLNNWITHGWLELHSIQNTAKFIMMREDCANNGAGKDYPSCEEQLGNEYHEQGIFHIGLYDETCGVHMGEATDGTNLQSGWMRLCSKNQESTELIVTRDDCVGEIGDNGFREGETFQGCEGQLGEEYYEAGSFHVGAYKYCDENDNPNDPGYVHMATSSSDSQSKKLESGWVTVCSKKAEVNVPYEREKINVLSMAMDDCSRGWESIKDSILGYEDGGSFHTWHTNVVAGTCEQANNPNLAIDHEGNWITHGWMGLQSINGTARFTILRDDCANNGRGKDYGDCPDQLGEDFVGHGIFHVGLVEDTCGVHMGQTIGSVGNEDGDRLESGWMRLCAKDQSARLIISRDDCANNGRGRDYGNCRETLGPEYIDAGSFHVGSYSYCGSDDKWGDPGYVYMASSWEAGGFVSIESGWVTMCSKQKGCPENCELLTESDCNDLENCGVLPDGCGGTFNCGCAVAGETCVDHRCEVVPNCVDECEPYGGLKEKQCMSGTGIPTSGVLKYIQCVRDADADECYEWSDWRYKFCGDECSNNECYAWTKGKVVDQSCEGDWLQGYTGMSCKNLYDDDWYSFADIKKITNQHTTGKYFVDYDKYFLTSGAKWEVKDIHDWQQSGNAQKVNLTVPNECLQIPGSKIKLKLERKSLGGGITFNNWWCYSGQNPWSYQGWVGLGVSDYIFPYEDQLWIKTKEDWRTPSVTVCSPGECHSEYQGYTTGPPWPCILDCTYKGCECRG